MLAVGGAAAVRADRGLVVCDRCTVLFEKGRSPRPDRPLRGERCAAIAHRGQKAEAARERRARERAACTTPKPTDGVGKGGDRASAATDRLSSAQRWSFGSGAYTNSYTSGGGL